MRKYSDIKNIVRLISLLFLFTTLLAACEYEFPEFELPDPSLEVSFSADVAPVFNSKGCIGCHKTGATSPDLSPGNAFNAIVPALVNLAEPELSRIYTVPAPMGNHIVKYSVPEANMVLNWIKQGALNN